MKKLVCGSFGTIYYAQLLKDGRMSSTNREEVTDDAITAVIDHIMCMPEYKKNNGFSGYDYKKKNGGEIEICVLDKDTHKVVHKNQWNEFDPEKLPTRRKWIGDTEFSKPLILRLDMGTEVVGYCNVTDKIWFNSFTEEPIDEADIVAWRYYDTYDDSTSEN